MGPHAAAWLVFGGVNGEAKVPEHQLAICLKENVLWLDVAVDDATGMQCLQHMQQWGDDLQVSQC